MILWKTLQFWNKPQEMAATALRMSISHKWEMCEIWFNLQRYKLNKICGVLNIKKLYFMLCPNIITLEEDSNILESFEHSYECLLNADLEFYSVILILRMFLGC